MSKEVNELLDKLGKLEDAPLIWINKKVYDASKEIERLNNIINELEIEANKNIQVCKNRGFNLISSINEVKTLDDFTLNEYIGFLVSLEILDKINELKGDSSNE